MTDQPHTPTDEPGYVAALKHAAGSYNSMMGPKGIARAIELIEAAAEQRGAVKALRDAASLARTCWTGNTNLPDPHDIESAYSFDRWLEVQADRLEGNDA